LGTGVCNTCESILLGGACDGSSRRIHKRQSSTNQGLAARSGGEFPVNTLSKLSRDTGVLAVCSKTKKSAKAGNRETRRLTGAGGVCGKRSKLGIQFLCVLSVLKFKTSTLRGGTTRSGRRGWRIDGRRTGVSRLVWITTRHGRGVAFVTTRCSRVLSEINELFTIWNRAVWTGGTRTGRIHRRRKSEGNRSRTPDWDTPDEGLGFSTGKLALEQSREFRVLGSLLAVRDAFRTWLMNVFKR